MDMKNYLHYGFATFVSICLFLLIYFLQDKDIKVALVGLVGLILGYFFGSSKGSADKNELLKKE